MLVSRRPLGLRSIELLAGCCDKAEIVRNCRVIDHSVCYHRASFRRVIADRLNALCNRKMYQLDKVLHVKAGFDECSDRADGPRHPGSK